MKKGKRKVGFIIGCVALSVLLAVSSYISLVIVGVVVDENKNGTLVSGNDDVVYNNNNVQNNNAIIGNPSVDNGTLPQGDNNNNGGYVNNNTVVQNNGTADVNNNPYIQQTPDADNSGAIQTVNALLDTNKTKADIVNIYALVMNKAKADKPGFTKIEYQELPDGEENRVISEGEENVTAETIDKLFGFVETLGVFVPKEKAESEPYIHEKGDEDMSYFPVFSREKGSYLTDPAGIESFTYKVLDNGNVKMTFVLVSEDNPEPIAENSNVAPSYTGAVFSPMSKERIDRTVNHPIVTVFAKNIEYSLRYHDCSVAVEFNPDTLQIAKLEQYANVSIKGSGDVVGVGTIGVERQELLSTVLIKDIKY